MFSDISYSQEHRPHLIMDDKKLMPQPNPNLFCTHLEVFIFIFFILREDKAPIIQSRLALLSSPTKSIYSIGFQLSHYNFKKIKILSLKSLN